MRTKEEIIKDLEKTIAMAKNEYNTCVEHDLDPDDFQAWMFGWMLGTIEHAKADLEQLK